MHKSQQLGDERRDANDKSDDEVVCSEYDVHEILGEVYCSEDEMHESFNDVVISDYDVVATQHDVVLRLY